MPFKFNLCLYSAGVLHDALVKARPGLLGCVALLGVMRPTLVLALGHVLLLAVLAWTVLGWGLNEEDLKGLTGLDAASVRDGSCVTAMAPDFLRTSGVLDFARMVFFGGADGRGGNGGGGGGGGGGGASSSGWGRKSK